MWWLQSLCACVRYLFLKYNASHLCLIVIKLLNNNNNHFTASFSGQLGYTGTRKAEPFWILIKQEMMVWQWHQLDHIQIICTSLQTDNHTSTSVLNFMQTGCSSCHPTNSVKALKAVLLNWIEIVIINLTLKGLYVVFCFVLYGGYGIVARIIYMHPSTEWCFWGLFFYCCNILLLQPF